MTKSDLFDHILGHSERIIGHLAWPLIALFIVYTFHSQIKAILEKIRMLKYKDAEILMGDRIAEAKEFADTTSDIAPPTKEPIDETLAALVRLHPAQAIAEAWKRVDAELYRLVKSISCIGYRFDRIKQITLLKDENKISDAQASLLSTLMALRNRAVHGNEEETKRGDAIDYIEVAARLEKTLKEIR
jgi:hypothetical protein